MAKYEDLSEDAKEVVDITKERFADLFDNDNYGPFLNDMSKYDDDRMAALLDIALGSLMLLMHTSMVNWTIKSFPYSTPICRQAAILALTVEVIRHFTRSYVEIPDTARVGAPDIVRRDYLSRWKDLLRDYEDQLKQAAKKMDAELYSMNAMNASRVLVDYPSMAGLGYMNYRPERPMFGGLF